jgi:hypothetical protein
VAQLVDKSIFAENKNIQTPKKTYSSWDSLVVTHQITNQPASGLSMAERTGSPAFHSLWPYVLVMAIDWVM